MESAVDWKKLHSAFHWYKHHQIIRDILFNGDESYRPPLEVKPPKPCTHCVYALALSNNTVKIGVTGKFSQRVKNIQSTHNLDVLKLHHTEFSPRRLAFQVEKLCHNAFADRRIYGEFFDISFEEACAELDRYNEVIAIQRNEVEKRETEYYNHMQGAFGCIEAVTAYFTTHKDKIDTKKFKQLNDLAKRVDSANSLQQFGEIICEAIPIVFSMVTPDELAAFMSSQEQKTPTQCQSPASPQFKSLKEPIKLFYL